MQDQLVDEFLAGSRRALARVITAVENDSPEKEAYLAQIYPRTGRAYVVGITGSPGAGKSSLVDELAAEIRRWGLKIGIIAVDPTSPFSGGALLGDRIRMQRHALDEGIFIRSMGTRGSVGGLSRATRDVTKVMDAFGLDLILIETVGVGQSELEIMNAAHTTVVVLTPGAGDVVQTLKAGIMEIADVFAVNKADMEGADRVAREVESMLDLAHKDWRPPVILTSTTAHTGIRELYDAIGRHKEFLEQNGKLEEIRRQRARSEVVDIVLNNLKTTITRRFLSAQTSDALLEQVVERKIDPYAAAGEILRQFVNLDKPVPPDVR